MVAERKLAPAYAVLSGLGAFLLFVVQPMAAKWLLPSLGGSASTWAACMLFFQTLLLGGYAYAHAGTRFLSPFWQVVVHCAVMLLAALLLSWQQAAAPALSSAWPPLEIARLLWLRVGPGYFVLACTAPLLQRWALLRLGAEPYALYAWSNAGSFAALLVYPLLIEPSLPLGAQLGAFRSAVLGFSLLLGALGVSTLSGLGAAARAPATANTTLSPLGLGTRARWLGYSFAPSMLLLAITNQVTVDIAPTPVLWVVPLALYLLSFVLAFGRWGNSLLGLALPLWSVSALLLGYAGFAQGVAPLWLQLTAALGAVFGCGLLCHAELVAQRPPAERLTSFYLHLASGGVLGGVFVSLLAPLVFSDYYEVELGVLLTYALLVVAARPGPPALDHAAARSAWSLGRRRLLQLGLGVCLPLMAASMITRAQGSTKTGSVVERRRSFLGPLRVVQLPVGRVLTHGRIRHGMQLSDPRLRRQPTMYFGPGTALSAVLSGGLPGRVSPRRIGVLGLGVGTIAAYGRSGDVMRFYELDRNVLELAQRDFTFLRDSAAQIQVQLGDGRLLLAREPAQRFDVLVLDAFSSDSVPVHLLTREAFGVYLRQLEPTGFLLANVSNRHLAVERVVRASAAAHGLFCRVVQTQADASRFVSKVRWAVMARSAAQVQSALQGMTPLTAAEPDVLWTDEHASLWSILR